MLTIRHIKVIMQNWEKQILKKQYKTKQKLSYVSKATMFTLPRGLRWTEIMQFVIK